MTDIQTMFKEKNREILITNLKYDLDKNIGSLMETVTNIFNLEFDTAILKLNTILKDSGNNDNILLITKVINNVKLDFYTIIEKLINNKKQTVLNNIETLSFKEKEMGKYYDMILDTTKKLKNSFSTEITTFLLKTQDSIRNEIDLNDITYTRINDYINDRLFGKLETKVHMEIMLRDNNLINKAKEGYFRYQDIVSKTENE